jgi:hypothetical protein
MKRSKDTDIGIRQDIQNAAAKLVMRHLHKFHRIGHFKVRNSLEIERETIKLYEYFGIYSFNQAEFFGGIFVFLLHILAEFFHI